MSRMPAAALLTLLTFQVAGADGQARQEADPRCGIEMRNVRMRLADDIVLTVRALDGELASRTRGAPPVFDDPQSYTLRLRAADVSMDTGSLTALLARALAGSASPVRDARVTVEGGALHVRGTLRKALSVPFSMVADVSAADGALRLHATKLKVAGVPVKGLLDVFGVDVADLLKAPGGAVRAEGDDLLIDAAALLPPPRTEGRVQSAAISGQRLVMRMAGAGSPPPRPPALPLPRARNYVYFFGGSIQFGKLTMRDADMQLIDADPRDAFDFYPVRYEAQLIAGYSRNTPRRGLQVFMPDYARVAGGAKALRPDVAR